MNSDDSLPRATLILIGDELTTGAINDTNGKWLSENLTELGFCVLGMVIVRDRVDEIVPAIKRAAFRADLTIATGGLGPTTDDITRYAFTKYLGSELVEHPSSLEKILKRYQQRGIPMNPISTRQALFPRGAEIINNSAGTADGFSCRLLDGLKPITFCLPGVPLEMKTIFKEEILPILRELFPRLKKPSASYLKCFGLSESAIGSAVEEAKLGEQFVVGYRPVFPEVWVKISGESVSDAECKLASEKASKFIGIDHVVSSYFEISIANVVLNLLRKSGLDLAFAESCTGGLASALLVSEPGASAVFKGGIVCYSNDVKVDEVGVRAETISRFGAVSPETALELAEGVRNRLRTSIGISITGVAGPEGGSSEKPVGTVFLGYSTEGRKEFVQHLVQFERNRFRSYTAHIALDLIRRDLLGFQLQFTRR